MLHASGNRFVTGGQPLEGDVRQYIWYSSPLFAEKGRWVRVRKWRALLRFSMMMHHRKGADWYVASLALITSELARIIDETLADAPAGGGDGSPGPCLEAQLIHIFASHYHWPAEYTREQPMRKLFQLIRNFTDDDDEGERRIKFAHLRQRNEELAKQRNAQPTEPANAQ